MKEIAILIPAAKWSFLAEEYETYEYRRDDIFAGWMLEVRRKVCGQLFDEGRVPGRIYFGNEFCERLIWTEAEVRKMAELCGNHGWKMSLVTPYCTDEGIGRIVRVLEAVKDLEPIDEIIVNDWGVLYRIREMFPRYACVFGRVLDKMKRDPRLSRKEYETRFSAEGLRLLQSPGASALAYREFMSECRVERLELDNVIQGLYLEDIRDKRISVYAPYGYVTNGKICPFAGIHNKPEEKFRVTTKCRRECQDYIQLMQKSLSALPSEQDERLDQVRVIRKGNTVFFMNEDIGQLLRDPHIDRIVYEPVVPM